MPMGWPDGPQPDGKAEHRRQGEGGPRSLAYAGIEIGGSDWVSLFLGCASDTLRNRGFGRRQGTCGPGARSAQFRVRCCWKPTNKLLDAIDESLYCLRASWRSGVVEHPRSTADLGRIGRNYLSVHNLRPALAQRNSVLTA